MPASCRETEGCAVRILRVHGIVRCEIHACVKVFLTYRKVVTVSIRVGSYPNVQYISSQLGYDQL